MSRAVRAAIVGMFREVRLIAEKLVEDTVQGTARTDAYREMIGKIEEIRQAVLQPASTYACAAGSGGAPRVLPEHHPVAVVRAVEGQVI